MLIKKWKQFREYKKRENYRRKDLPIQILQSMQASLEKLAEGLSGFIKDNRLHFKISDTVGDIMYNMAFGGVKIGSNNSLEDNFISFETSNGHKAQMTVDCRDNALVTKEEGVKIVTVGKDGKVTNTYTKKANTTIPEKEEVTKYGYILIRE